MLGLALALIAWAACVSLAASRWQKVVYRALPFAYATTLMAAIGLYRGASLVDGVLAVIFMNGMTGGMLLAARWEGRRRK